VATINVGDLEAVLRLRDEMSSQIQATMSTLDKLDQALGVTDQALDHVQKHSETAGVALGVVLGGWIEKTAEKLKDLGVEAVMTAARVETLTGVSHFMGDQAGYTHAQIDALSQSLQKQGITTQQSRDTIIQLIRANLDLGKASQLAAVAQSAARATGENSSETLNRLIHGIQTLQPEVLRTSGIVVSADQEYQKWAATHGRLATSMSGVEKQQALMSAVLREGEKIAGVYGVTNEFVGGKLQSLKRYQEEAGLAIGQFFLPALRFAVDALTALLKQVAAAPGPFMALAAGIVLAGTALQVEWLVPAMLVLAGLDLLIGAFTGTLDPVTNLTALLTVLGATAQLFADILKSLSGGLIDFETAAKNADIIGAAFSVTITSAAYVAANLSIGLLEAAKAMALMHGNFAAAKDLDENITLMKGYVLALSDEANQTVTNIDATGKANTVRKTTADLLAELQKHAAEVAAATAEAARKEAEHAAALKAAAAAAKKHAEEIKHLTEQYHAMFSELNTSKELDKLSILFATVSGNLHKLSGDDIVKAVTEFHKFGEEGKNAAEQILQAWDGVGAHMAHVRQDEMVKTVEALMKQGQVGVEAAQKYEAAWTKSTGDVMRLVGHNGPDLTKSAPGLTPLANPELDPTKWQAVALEAADTFDNAFETEGAKRKWFFANFDPISLGSVKFEAIAKALGVKLEGTVDKTEKVTKATFDWQKAIQTTQSTMQLLGITTDSAMGTIVNSIGLAVAGYQGLIAVHKTYTDAVVEHGKDSEQAKEAHDAETMYKVQQAYLAAATAVSIYSKNKENLNAGAATASGAASGAAVGMSMAGGWGALVGAVVGGLIGFFSGQKWRAMAKSAGDVLGVEMTDALAKAVDATMKKLNVSASTAGLLNLDKAMSTSSKTAASFAPQVLALLAGVAAGAIPAKEGVEQITKAWQLMSAEAGEGRVTKEMLAIMSAAKQAGVAVAGIQEFIKGLATKAIPVLESAWNSMSAHGGLSVNEIHNRLEAYEETLKNTGLTEDELAAKLAEREHQLRKTQFATEDDAKSMDQLANLTAGAFQAMMDSGASLTEVFQQIGPLIDSAVAAYDRMGIAIPAVLANVVQLRNFVSAHQDMANAMMGWGEVIKLAAAGFGNLDDAVAQVGVHMHQAEDAGLSHAQALYLNRDALREIDYLYTHGLLPNLDEGTKKLLEEGHASGILDPTPQEAMATATQHLVEIMALLATHFGVILPKAIQDYIGALNKIPKTPVPGPPEVPGAPPPGEPPEAPDPTITAAVGYYTPMLGQNTTIHAHRGERVEITPAGTPTAMRNGGDAGGGDVHIHIDARGSSDPSATLQLLNDALQSDRGGLRTAVTELARRQAMRR
jgi:hypothetical protein